MGRGRDIAERARALVGVPFRPQGRDPATGVDCIGLAAIAAQLPLDRVRRDYALRGGRLSEVERALARLGFQTAADAQEGDLVLVQPGPAQLHFLVMTRNGLVHADARLRRVAERPLPIPWPVLGTWRLKEE